MKNEHHTLARLDMTRKKKEKRNGIPCSKETKSESRQRREKGKKKEENKKIISFDWSIDQEYMMFGMTKRRDLQ